MRKGERGRRERAAGAPLQRRLSHKSVLAAEAFYRRCLPHRRHRGRRTRGGGGVNRQYTRWMRPSASPPTIFGERRGGRGWLRREGGRKSGSVRRKKAIRCCRRREQPEEAEKEEDNIGGAGARVVDGWMDVWLRECDSQVFFFQQASSRRAGRPSISFLAQESSLKHGKLDWLGRGPM